MSSYGLRLVLNALLGYYAELGLIFKDLIGP